MESPPLPLSRPPGPHARGDWTSRLLFAAIVVAVGWFYLWTVRPEETTPAFAPRIAGYYNLLTRGFLKGHLYLDVPGEATSPAGGGGREASEPPVHAMHDASYFNGRIYLYFGVTPAVLLFLPVRLASGLDIDQDVASVVFAWTGLAASAGLLGAVRRRYFPALSPWIAAIGVAALGLTNSMPILLRRASIWEVPITCAYACCMVGLCLLYAALHSGRRRLFLGLASAALGLAVGARPTYLAGCVALLVPLVYWCRESGGIGRALGNRSWWADVAAATMPLGAVGAGLAAYNYQRFGSILEFGQHYQMFAGDGPKTTLFNWRFIPYGLRVYLLPFAHWVPYFPFVSVADIPPGPPGQFGVEDAYGIISNIPYVLLGLGTLALGRGGDGRRADLAVFCRTVAVGSAATGLATLSFWFIANRYMVDFLPGFVLLASIGLLVAASYRTLNRGSRTVAGAAVLLVFLYSAGFNVLASLRHNELLRVEHPELYKRMAHAWNQVPYAFDRWFHGAYGDLQIKAVFPTDRVGLNEPLVVTGHSFLADYLVVHYEPHDRVSFGLIHTNEAPIFGDPIWVKPGVVHTVTVRMGSLFPPPGHPYFDRMDPVAAVLMQSLVKVTVDGKVALDSRARFYDATSWEPSIGRSDTGVGDFRPFSGKILGWSRIPPSGSDRDLDIPPPGPVRLDVVLPPFTAPRNEPLVCSGSEGRGDLVYIAYLARDAIAVGFDHWGVGGPLSRPIRITPSSVVSITVDYGVLHSEAKDQPEGEAGTPGRLVVVVNGATLLDQPQAYYRCNRALVALCRNTIGSSMALPAFSGTLVKSAYLGK